MAFEHTRLMGKYGAVPPPSSVITDADPEVGALAPTLIEEQPLNGLTDLQRKRHKVVARLRTVLIVGNDSLQRRAS